MKRAAHAVAWLLLVTAAFVLWPQRWGGSMTYVVTTGTSMAPQFTAGDLALLRTASAYDVGDVVAYDSAELGRIVMHRVVRATPEGFVLRGDANDFDDPEVVPQDRVLGELVLRLPAAGRAAAWLAEPLHLGMLAVGLVLLGGDRAASRRTPATAPARPTSLQVRRLDLPTSVVTAHVVEREDLEALAEATGRPVLEVAGLEDRYVVDAGVVYVWQAENRSNERRRTPQGRDWAYDRPRLVAVPEPRSSSVRVS